MKTENDYLPKVLILSHEVINLTTSVGKTLSQYFSNWPTNKICQVYLHSELPTTHICEEYYRITDFDIIRSFIPFKSSGRAIIDDEIDENRISARTDTGLKHSIYRKGQQKKSWMFPVRDFLWSFGTWKSKSFNNWLKQCKADVVFFPTSDYLFPYHILEYITNQLGIPVVVCVFDDYYFSTIMKDSYITKGYIKKLRKILSRTILRSKYVLYNQPKMQQLYAQMFPNRSDNIFVTTNLLEDEEKSNNPIKLSYFGSLGLGRDDSIVKIGRAIREVAPEQDIYIDVYSSETDPTIIQKLNQLNRINFHGEITATDVKRVISETNILVLPESFDPIYRGRIEYALSTKVAEYLGSNRCILAFGPDYSGTIGYLKDNNVGAVATSIDQLSNILRIILFDKETRKRISADQRKIAQFNHSNNRNDNVLKNALCRSVEP